MKGTKGMTGKETGTGTGTGEAAEMKEEAAAVVPGAGDSSRVRLLNQLN